MGHPARYGSLPKIHIKRSLKMNETGVGYRVSVYIRRFHLLIPLNERGKKRSEQTPFLLTTDVHLQWIQSDNVKLAPGSFFTHLLSIFQFDFSTKGIGTTFNYDLVRLRQLIWCGDMYCNKNCPYLYSSKESYRIMRIELS